MCFIYILIYCLHGFRRGVGWGGGAHKYDYPGSISSSGPAITAKRE